MRLWTGHSLSTLVASIVLCRIGIGANAQRQQFPIKVPTGYGASAATATLNDPNDKLFESYMDFSDQPQTVPVASWIRAEDDRVVDLHTLSDDYYTHVSHARYPHHAIRIKSSKGWCDSSVKSYTGYIDIGAKHLFFYFFESRSPSSDIILWTNGGPGCSSSLGLFMELGPCQILSKDDIPNPKYNPYSWNSNASVIFIDQPVGVGYSYADYGEHVGRTEEAAKDIAAFVAIFMERFVYGTHRGTDKGDVKLHLAGESYGGRYIPVFAAEIIDQNIQLREANLTTVPLKSIMIGNGMTDFISMMASYYDMQCTNASVEPVLPISTCVRIRKALPRCQALLESECLHRFDTMSCQAAATMCDNEIALPFFSSGLNPYDISKKCDGPIEETLCYPLTKYIGQYLNLPDTRRRLGVDGKVGEFRSCSDAVGEDFRTHLDEMRTTSTYVEGLLERGINVLIYVGTYDWICNHVGNYRWTAAFDWFGHDEFDKEELRDWKVDGEVAGRTRSAQGLTFATVFRAGHMVPYDKPKQALAMLNRWMAGKGL